MCCRPRAIAWRSVSVSYSYVLVMKIASILKGVALQVSDRPLKSFMTRESPVKVSGADLSDGSLVHRCRDTGLNDFLVSI